MNAAETIAGQRQALSALYRRHVSLGQPYALLDFPHHGNVGDSAIWAGEAVLLREIAGREPAYVSTAWNCDFDAVRAACADGPVFLHGGGNLGDIWPEHQRFRERALAELTRHSVVQLPQTIKYRDPQSTGSFRRSISTHPDFHLYVRDQRSADFAREFLGINPAIAPDSAFGLGPQFRGDPDVEILALMRSDAEAAQGLQSEVRAAFLNAEIVDWLDEPVVFELKRKLLALPVLLRGTSAAERRVFEYDWLAKARVDRGLRLLSRGKMVVTDRLHAHILCILLDLPHVVLDNDYGKIDGYLKAWTGEFNGVVSARSGPEAARLVEGRFASGLLQ